MLDDSDRSLMYSGFEVPMCRGLVVIRRIRIGLGSDIPNKDQTYPVPCVGKASMRYMSPYQSRTPANWSRTCVLWSEVRIRHSTVCQAVQCGCRKMGSCRSMLRSWSPFPASSIRLVWGSNPRPIINDAAVVVGSIPSFLWSDNNQTLSI